MPAEQPAPAPAAPPAPASPAEPSNEVTKSDAEIIAEAEAALAGDAKGEGEVIVVTGSAIERTETTTPAPVTVLDRVELEAAGMASIGDILQDLPAQSNAINTQANNGGDGATRINIRGLGTARTLVLMNGRRLVPGGTGADASVDLNSIPLAVIERIEVLKDGASAVYGSDAVGGVVNIITRSGFQGTEASFYTGTTQNGGGTVYDVSFISGQNSTRGNVIFSAGYFDQGDIFANQRGFSDPQRDLDFETGVEQPTGSNTTPEGTIFDRVCKEGETPQVNGCAASKAELFCPSGFCFRGEGGTWRDFDDSGNTDTGTGDLWNFQPDNYLLVPQRRYNVFSNGNYKFHDNVRGFFEASYLNRQSDQQLAPEPLVTAREGILIAADNVYNPYGRAFEEIRKRMVETGPRTTRQDIDTFRVVTGVDGALPGAFLDGWRYELSYNFGRTVGTVENGGNLIRPNVGEALGPSYIDGDGVARCGTREDPGTPGCVPLDILGGIGSVTPEMVDWITYTGVARGYNRQHTAMAKASGPVVDTPWGGNVVLALGADYRYEAGGSRPDPLTASGNTTGVKVEPTGGHYDVVEGFAELSVVPVTNKEWAKWLEINGAARAVDYSTFGSNFSWKAGVLYKIPAGLAVRGTYSTAFRAPNVSELFAGAGDAFPPVTDPCDTSNGPLSGAVAANCAADQVPNTFRDSSTQLPSRIGGNEELEPETAKVLTTGIVYEPTFAENLAFTVDYFDVSLDNAIQPAGANILLSNCYASPNRTDCDKITRAPGSSQIVEIDDRTVNIGRATTSGIDASIGYRYAVHGVGTFRHDLEGTRLLKFDNFFPDGMGGEVKHEGLGVFDLGTFPKYKANLSTMWGLGGIGAGFNVRYIHKFRECRSADGTVVNDCSIDGALSRKVSANVTADALASYTFANPIGKTIVSGGVNNVLDQKPPNIYNGFIATSDSNTYDYMGRFFYVRLTQGF
ncbi:MAG TPA: TonB-dependent receptor [Kofleriaceae bacterium]|nr:TonB-dependent receptor [Kofleriaceae bacterium]